MKQRSRIWILLLIAVLCLAGCSKNSVSRDYANGYSQTPAAAEQEVAYISEGAVSLGRIDSDGSLLPEGRKLIRNATVEAETQDMDGFLSGLEAKTAAAGGYVERMETYHGSDRSTARRYAYLTLRIPADDLDSFLSQVGEISNVIRRSISMNDVTTQYVDTESQKKALEVEQERLLALLEKAESLEDILALEERLTDVRYRLESLTTQLRTLDNQIDYSTVELEIREVRELTEEEPEGFWARLGSGFVQSLRRAGVGIADAFAWFVIALPYLAILAAVFLVIFLPVRRSVRKRRQRRSGPSAPPAPEKPE